MLCLPAQHQQAGVIRGTHDLGYPGTTDERPFQVEVRGRAAHLVRSAVQYLLADPRSLDSIQGYDR